MIHFYSTLLLCLIYFGGYSQNCLPDSTLVDSSAGVYPKPVTPENPNGGIKKKACINKPYDFTFTVVVPDSVTVPIFPNPIPLDRVSIDTVGAITNLPLGIGYACNPPNCIYKKNSIGCLILNGTPTPDNLPGDFKPVIKLKLTINLGVPFDYTTEYPGMVFPGEYILTLLSEQDCASSTGHGDASAGEWYPNPVINQLHNPGTDIRNIKIFDLQGKCWLARDQYTSGSSLEIGSEIPEGIYFLQWTQGRGVQIRKIKIAR
ncbi:MAG TPA: T9SS type A sorting domain-containing protein [Saprospiraceae bacterium]|nr:T9SS type A sorting domain-containing protein [Saprospiraceae bacterium]